MPAVAAVAHYERMQRLQAAGVVAARRAWRRVGLSDLSGSWAVRLRVLVPALTALQVEAASAGAAYGAAVLAEQGEWVAPDVFVDPRAFGGFASDGRSLEGLLYSPVTSVKSQIGSGVGGQVALASGQALLDRAVQTLIADTGRQAAGADVASRAGVGYVRMLNPPSCDRCTILAGRFYRWNAGFLRHPRCDCIHQPSRSLDAARSEGLVDDPYEYFRGLSEAEQDKAFGRASAQAIRDGSDMFQVVNARRGMTPNGLFTTEGARRGNAAAGLRRGQRRMTPELIYQQAGSRDEALSLLETHGYVLPGGQVPSGALRGQREGFGQMGRGGTRRAASAAVVEARRTGVRDPRSRYTMTTSERRLYDAEQRYLMVLEGRNPFASPGFGNVPDPYGLGLNRGGVSRGPLTPQIAALVETDYRRWLTSGGQVFIN